VKKGDILFCGVGGQGIILASEIISLALIRAGFDVKKSEVHGMAQRGGSVVAHVRYGEKIFSPLIGKGGADIVVAFEFLESLRYLPFMHEDTKVVLNTQKVYPPSVATGKEEYPEEILEEFEKRGIRNYPVAAFEIATSVRELRTVNMVMSGALSVFLPVEEELFFDVISGKVPNRYFDANRKAFLEGSKSIRKLGVKA